jgi:uncharacterized protein
LVAAVNNHYQAPWWLGGRWDASNHHASVGAHAQTVYTSLFGHRPQIEYVRERWDSTPNGQPDGDFVDVDRIASTVSATDKPMLIVFHGLEGSSQGIYALNLMFEAQQRGWRGMVPHFRGCSGEINRLPRAYHSGDAAEIEWIVKRAKAETPTQPLYVAGISLGGNATMKWLGDAGGTASPFVTAAAAISSPLDLMAAGNALEQGFCKVYTKNFLVTMKRKSLAKLDIHPGIFRREVAQAARTLREFDNEVTAPLHGYRDTDDYWTRGSAKPGLIDIRVPSLLLNATNDPFLPASALPTAAQVSSDVIRDFPAQGGHVGFLSGPFPGHGRWMSERVMRFLERGE